MTPKARKNQRRVCGGHPENPFQRERKKAGLTQEGASEALSCSPRSIQAYEKGETRPRYDTVRNMANIYGCSMTAFDMSTAAMDGGDGAKRYD